METDEHLILLGRVVVQWSKLEYLLRVTLGNLSGLQPAAALMFTEGLGGTSRLVDRARAFAEMHLRGSEREAFLSWLADVTEIAKERNKLMHRLHGLMLDPATGHMMPTQLDLAAKRPPVRMEARVLRPEDLRDLLDRMAATLRATKSFPEWVSTLPQPTPSPSD
jgi:hypothetical protein